jgi:catalase
LWERVFDDKAKNRFVKNVSGHIGSVQKQEIIKRQITIFREVNEDLASRPEKATGIQGYKGISDLSFNGTHNGMAKDKKLRAANDMNDSVAFSGVESNGASV